MKYRASANTSGRNDLKTDGDEEVSWKTKPFLETYHQQIDEVNFETKEAGVYHSQQDPSCRLCKGVPETVQHIVAGCKRKFD